MELQITDNQRIQESKKRMVVKDIVDENYQDYKKPSMLIASASCDWKCCIESGYDKSLCQNSSISLQKSINIQDDIIVNRYLDNPLTQAIIFGGLEPFLQAEEVLSLVDKFREFTNDDIVIYTGYYEFEVVNFISELSKYKNIIIKYGRFIPDNSQKYDDVLGVQLSSINQYAKRIS